MESKRENKFFITTEIKQLIFPFIKKLQILIIHIYSQGATQINSILGFTGLILNNLVDLKQDLLHIIYSDQLVFIPRFHKWNKTTLCWI